MNIFEAIDNMDLEAVEAILHEFGGAETLRQVKDGETVSSYLEEALEDEKRALREYESQADKEIVRFQREQVRKLISIQKRLETVSGEHPLHDSSMFTAGVSQPRRKKKGVNLHRSAVENAQRLEEKKFEAMRQRAIEQTHEPDGGPELLEVRMMR